MRTALTKVDGIKDLKTDVSSKTCSFKVDQDFDYEAKLNEIAETNEHVKGWSKAN